MKYRPTSCFAVICALSAAVLASGISRPVGAQEHEHPTAEEFAEDMAAAQAAPLFASEQPMAMTLLTNIKWLRDERPDEEEVEGTITLTLGDGTELAVPVEVRARGNFRRDKRNCNFPPLRLDFPKSEMDGTVFEGQDKVKLVTPCHDSRDSYQTYVYLEYLAYQAFNLLTPLSNRVRLVEITYVDINDEYDTRTKIGFLIESDEAMAARNNGVVEEVGQLHPAQTNGDYAVMMSLFQYMIGNTDWSSLQFHNVKLVHTQDDRFYTVPYDFDFSGLVDARYAVPDESLSIRSVTDRVFRGFCFPQVRQRERWVELFSPHRQTIDNLFLEFELLEEGDRDDPVDFLEEFWETLGDERRYEREIINNCRG